MCKREHAEPAPSNKEGEQCWYFLCFGVTHIHKPDEIRVVFDSNALYVSISLNDVLLTGSNLNKDLIGALLHFR